MTKDNHTTFQEGGAGFYPVPMQNFALVGTGVTEYGFTIYTWRVADHTVDWESHGYEKLGTYSRKSFRFHVWINSSHIERFGDDRMNGVLRTAYSIVTHERFHTDDRGLL